MDVFHGFQALEVKARLGFTPAGAFADFASGEAGELLLELPGLHRFADVGFYRFEQSAGLRWEFVEAAAQDFGGDLVRGSDVFQGDRQHYDRAAVDGVSDGLALVLVEKCDGIDQGQILFVVAARAGASAGEGEFAGVGVGDAHRLDESLRVLHDALNVLAAFGSKDAFDRAGFTLQGVDALGLRGGFIDGQHKAAVHEFLVDVDGSGC